MQPKIVLVFVTLLFQQYFHLCFLKMTLSNQAFSRKHKMTKICNNPARDNWHLAYTVFNNDHLRHLRKHAIEKRKELSVAQSTTTLGLPLTIYNKSKSDFTTL